MAYVFLYSQTQTISEKSHFRGPFNMVTRPNTFEIRTTPTLPYLLFRVIVFQLEKVCLSDTQNIRTVC